MYTYTYHMCMIYIYVCIHIYICSGTSSTPFLLQNCKHVILSHYIITLKHTIWHFRSNVQIKTINYYTYIITLPTTLKQALLMPGLYVYIRGYVCVCVYVYVCICIYIHIYTHEGLSRKSLTVVNITRMVCMISMWPDNQGEWTRMHMCEQWRLHYICRQR